MKCYECKWLDRSVILTSSPPQYGCTLGFGSHYADHECEYDFMPIVRCKDCKHYIVEGITTQYGWCHEYKHSVDEDDYCSYGERKK
jgi:hypothetical protein